MKVYTKGGDKGQTSLFGGRRVSKADLRLESYGTIDELNSFVGWLAAKSIPDEVYTHLEKIQNDLFTLGSRLAADDKADSKMIPQLDESRIGQLEQWIDEMEETLPALKNFILPGGSEEGALAHVCRTVCRRAERLCVRLMEDDQSVGTVIVPYLNRLSDTFFVLSRYLVHKNGHSEVVWQPKT